jgi:N-acetylglucosamine kinase-like BadF-type ATPase
LAEVLGFDGGGTRCEAIRLSDEGRVLAHGIGGTTHEWYGQERLVEASVSAALESALPEGAAKPSLAVLTGPSGERAAALIRAAIEPSPLQKVSEAECFLAASLETSGLVALAGTGSFVHGRRPDGRWITAGGAGPVIGDDGSGFDLGIRAIRATCLAASLDHYRGPLVDAVMDEFGCQQRWDLVTLYHHEHPSRQRIAGLAPLVTRHAETGDPVALGILDEAARALAQIARAVVDQLGLHRVRTVILAGGTASSSAYQEALRAHLEPIFPRPVDIRRPKYRPAVGSALIALKYLGVDWSGALIDQLDAELADHGLGGAAKE